MLETREIECFIACARSGSFSQAAQLLYTTQSTISKIIHGMEEKLGYPLFERGAKGIVMTPRARELFPQARDILENLNALESSSGEERIETLSISTNPSSWLADTFLAFFREYKRDSLCYQYYSADTTEIVERVRGRSDELGFAYVAAGQMSAFSYYLGRNYLEGETLAETQVRVWGQTGEVDFGKMQLIQRFPDEYSADTYRGVVDGNGRSFTEARTVITTNSDYVMERILREGTLVNVSGGYLSGTQGREAAVREYSIIPDAKMHFVAVRRRGESLSEAAEAFLGFVRERLKL